jgi:hypothetical protein
MLLCILLKKADMWYNNQMFLELFYTLCEKKWWVLSSFLGFSVVVITLFLVLHTPGSSLTGRVLEGSDLVRKQVESDFDQDGDVDFLDFTVFSAFYEEEV